ncbi:hypothetical protein T484DRAFT_1765719 [Baffinella frigidus]|nr:hypothetical protein T484DRAFT_1765719 [Cryptophyta sp. CCMP2293]
MVSTLHSEPDPNTAKFTQLHVLSALEIWKTYLKNKTKISGWVDKYDGNHTGKLNIEEFKHLIHDLKHGEEYTATDEDIAKCFHDASLRPENEKNDMVRS